MELHKASAPEPPGTSQGICTGNLTSCLHRSPLEPHQVSAPKPSGTLQTEPSGTFEGVCPEPSGTSPLIFTRTPRNPGICTRNFLNLTRYPHQNPPESHKVSAPETSGTYLQPSGTARVICTGTLRNLTSCLHRSPPESHQVSAPEISGTLSGTWCWSCTGSHRSKSELKTSVRKVLLLGKNHSTHPKNYEKSYSIILNPHISPLPASSRDWG